MNNTALATMPNSDQTTLYISAWAEHTIEQLESKHIQFFILTKERATLSVFESMLKKHKPSLVFINGHGGSDLVCGHKDEELVKVGKNESLLKETITYALSCSSAKKLGPSVVKAGAVAYIGYIEDFIFFISPDKRTRPLEDKTAEIFLAPANHVIVSLTKGHTVLEATNATKGYFLKNIQKLISSESSVDEREYLRYLIWDMRNLVGLGNQKATVI